MGHLKMISKGIQPTHQASQPDEPDEPEPLPAPITAPTNNILDVYVYCFENPLYNDRNIIGVDLPGRYPDTSFGSRGFYVGPAIKHYRNYVCFMSESKALRTSNTVDFFLSRVSIQL